MASYPADNAYFLSCDKPQYDPALLKLQDTLNGATIREVLTTTSKALQKCNEQLGVNDPYDEQDQSEGDEEESFFMGDHSQGAAVNDNLEDDDSDFRSLNDADAETIDKRIVTDLLRLKSSGYRVGILKGMKARSRNSILSISYRIARLKLGDDVLEAWNLDPSHYIVLLIHYANGYQSLDDVYDAAIQNITVDFRVGTCSRYKPSLGSAIAAFGVARQHFATKGASSATSGGIHATTNSAADDGSVSTESTGAQFSICFISSPMHQLLSASFLSMLKIRVNHQCSWESAKAFLRENAQVNAKDSDYADFNHVMEDISEKTLPSIVLEDHLAPNSCEPGERLSLPLIAMQFTLLYFVRCTEFCLVCHRPVSQNFEALKPYVCDNPLCLYQYMTLGFGPSIEQEILHQPYVVDLLVSFTYSAALDNRLREYPVGMGLTVPTVTTPPIPQKRQRIAGTANFAILSPAPNSTLLQGLVPGTAILAGRVVPVAPLPTTPTDNPFKFAGYGAPLRTHEVKIDLVAGVLTFVSAMESMPALPVKPGTWVMLYVYTGASQDIYHVRVHDCRLPELKFSLTPDQAVLANKISSAVSGERHAIKKPDSNEWYKDFDGHCAIYENNFDDLDDQLKATAICELLHTLPSIHEMVQYLSLSSSSQSSLSTWHDRIPPAALGILRWIVASNRSCIVQVSELKGMGPGIGKSRVEQKLTKIDDYVQFRFAQGAPSKEALFHKALKELGGKEKEIAVCSASSLAAPSANIFGSGAQQGVPNAFSQLGVNVSQKLKNIPPPQYPSQVPLQQTTFSLQAPRPLPILVPPMPLSPQVPPQQAPLSLHALPVPQSQFVDPVVQQELLSAFAEFSRQADSLNTQVADHVSNGGAIATLNTGIVQLQLKVQFDKVNNLIKGMTIKPGHTVVSNTDAKMVRGSAQRLAGAIPTTGAVRMPLGWKPALGASAPNRSAPSSLPLPHSDSSGAMNNRTVGTSSPFTNGPFMQIGTTFLFAGSGIFFLKKRAVCIGAKVKPHPAFPSGGQGGEQVPFFGPLYANPQSQTAAPGTRPTMASASQKPSPAANMAAKMSPAASTAKTAADAAKAGSILGGPNGGPSLFRGPVNSPPLSGAKDLIVTLQKLLASAGIAPAANSNVTQAIGLIPGPKQPTMVFAPPVNAGAGAAPATRTLGSLFKPVTRSQNKRKNPPSPATATAPAPTAEIVKRHPSLFAWHGSGISNWHSIIRQGLDFKETLNGRAFGHGIYHSLDFDTSLGYSHNRGVVGYPVYKCSMTKR